MLIRGTSSLLPPQCSSPHLGGAIETIGDCGGLALYLLSFSRLNPFWFHPFPKIKKSWPVAFLPLTDAKGVVGKFSKCQTKEFFSTGIKMFRHRWERVLLSDVTMLKKELSKIMYSTMFRFFRNKTFLYTPHGEEFYNNNHFTVEHFFIIPNPLI